MSFFNFVRRIKIRISIFFARYMGRKRVYCAICQKRSVRFLAFRGANCSAGSFIDKLDIVGSDPKNFSCPRCFSTDRERHLRLYFEENGIFEQYVLGKRVLYIAPEEQFKKLVYKAEPIELVEGDLYPKAGQVKVDLTNMNFDDNSFDLVICNHVLEHVVDVKLALSELRRVLKVGGSLVAQTPYSSVLRSTLEIQEAWGDPSFCEVSHGQSDHLRVFGANFKSLVCNEGFSDNCISHSDLNITDSPHELGIQEREDFFFFSRMV